MQQQLLLTNYIAICVSSFIPVDSLVFAVQQQDDDGEETRCAISVYKALACCLVSDNTVIFNSNLLVVHHTNLY